MQRSVSERVRAMFTGNQIWAARILAGLSPNDIAERAGISVETLQGIESAGGTQISPSEPAVERLMEALDNAGVEFLDGPGLRLRSGTSDEGLRPEQLNAENDG